MEPPNESFQNALLTFKDSLTEKQRNEFTVCSLQDVQDTIQKIDARLGAKRQQRNMQKMAKFVEGMSQLGQIVELFLNVDASVAFVWAPIKFLLLVAGTWVETLDCLLDTYSEIGDVLPGLTQYKELVPKYPFIKVHLENYYCAVLEFHRKALDVFSRPNWKMTFHSSWRTFKTRFGATVRNLKRYRDLLSDEKITATILEVQGLRQSMEEKLKQLDQNLQELHIDVDESSALRHRELLHTKRQFVMSKLDPPDHEYDFERASKERRGTPTGSWVLGDTRFQEWLDQTNSKHRTLYVSGIPGTGKTIFASWVVEHLKKLQVSAKDVGLGVSLVYFFFKHSQTDKRTMKDFLVSAICQLVFQDEVVLDIIYQKCLSVDQQRIRSESLLYELAAMAIGSQRSCFVVIDGLDECLGDSMVSDREAQEEVIDWFERLVREENTESPEADDRSIRLLVCAQRNGVIEERLSLCPQIKLELVDAHLGDLRTYAESKSILIQQKFSKRNKIIDEESRKSIVDRVCSGAKGMFLYAKIVLGNLLSQVSIARFKRELETEIFPKGLDEAYQRVVICVLEDAPEKVREAARQILALVLSAERPLMWKEVQSHFCIELDDGISDPDLRLLDSCKYYCGSLVEVEHQIKSKSGADGIVHLVHETARAYLLHTGRFSLEAENTRLALLYARYLNSQAVSSPKDESGIKRHFTTGYYGILDYAAANWWKHTSRLMNSASPNEEDVTTLLQISHKLQAPTTAKDRPKKGKKKPTSVEFGSLRERLRQLPAHGRDWEDAFPVEDNVRRIRATVEALLADKALAKLEHVQELYGTLSYKCPKSWCHFFLSGFETSQERDNHLSEHERPFRCDVDGCYGSKIGFPLESDLAKHNTRLHIRDLPLDFPSLAIELAKADRTDIFKVAAKGDLALVKDLLASGCDVNLKSPDGLSPLHSAAGKGHLEVCHYLLDQGAEPDAKCAKGKTALHLAVLNNDHDIAHLLISKYGASTNLRDGSGRTAVGIAWKRDCKAVIAAFTPESLAHKFCDRIYCEVVAVEVPSREGIKGGIVDSLIAALDFPEIDAKSMFDNGCFDLNHEGRGNETSLPFNIALANGHTDFAEHLLRSGRLLLDQLDVNGSLPLHLACKYISSRHIIEELLARTRLIETKDSHGDNLVHLLLKNKNLSVSKGEDDYRTSLISRILGSGKVDVNLPNTKDHLPLHTACKYGNLGVVSLLVPLTSEIDARDYWGYTPLHLAADGGHWDIVDILIEAGHSVDLLREPLHSKATLDLRCNRAAMDRLFWKKSSIDFSHTGLTNLHWGAWSLSHAVIQEEEKISDANINTSALDLPHAWEQGLKYSVTAINHSALRSLLLTPLFLALNAAGIESAGLADLRRDVLIGILNFKNLNISQSIRNLSEQESFIPTQLVIELGNAQLWESMVKVGFVLPWKLITWKNSATIYMPRLPPSQTDKQAEYLDIPQHLVLLVIQGSQCSFLDILKSNFDLADRIVCYLSEDELTDIKLDFGSIEHGLELLTEIHKRQGLSTLHSLIKIGFDGYSALLNAAYLGRSELVELLLETRMLDEEHQRHVTDPTGAAAYDIAVREGHSELAELLLKWNFYGAEVFAQGHPSTSRDSGPDGSRDLLETETPDLDMDELIEYYASE